MLFEKGGTITEDRFQKMSFVQWFFHYKEIQKHKTHEANFDKSKFEFYKAMIDRVCDRLDFVALMVDREAAGQVLKDQHGKDPAEVEKELMEDYEELKKSLPDTIMVDLTKKNEFILPKIQRPKPGIFMEDGE